MFRCGTGKRAAWRRESSRLLFCHRTGHRPVTAPDRRQEFFQQIARPDAKRGRVDARMAADRRLPQQVGIHQQLHVAAVIIHEPQHADRADAKPEQFFQRLRRRKGKPRTAERPASFFGLPTSSCIVLSFFQTPKTCAALQRRRRNCMALRRYDSTRVTRILSQSCFKVKLPLRPMRNNLHASSNDL